MPLKCISEHFLGEVVRNIIIIVTVIAYNVLDTLWLGALQIYGHPAYNRASSWDKISCPQDSLCAGRSDGFAKLSWIWWEVKQFVKL